MDSAEAQQRARVRRAAEETLRQWPAAQAAVLFGSRARGEHRPDSDWDIAIEGSLVMTEEDYKKWMAGVRGTCGGGRHAATSGREYKRLGADKHGLR